MTFKPLTTTVLAASAALFANTAMANSVNDDIAVCLTAFEDAAPEGFDGADYRFKAVRGGGVRKLKFDIRKDGSKAGSVTCKVKRGEVSEIVWPV